MRNQYSTWCSVLLCCCLTLAASSESNGFLKQGDILRFPLGFYELPQDDAALKRMAESGVNLVRCNLKQDLDRVHALGMQAWVPLSLDAGSTDTLRTQIESFKNHPALAVWEGPDEVVWNFTAFSGLYKTMGVYPSKDEWQRQTPKAIEYSEARAAEIIPNMRAAAELLRSLDASGRPIWINEAQKSDVKFVRQYLPFVDITGCDIYPVSAKERPIERLGSTTDRWNQVGKGKPVWMVLQAFSWDELGGDYVDRGTAFPSFAESRFMAYDAIAHGAKGILYWGSYYTKSPEFRTSLYAVTSELAALQPFLVSHPEVNVRVRLIEVPEESGQTGVVATLRRAGEEWLMIVVNEDAVVHLGVEISGLEVIESKHLELLYGSEAAVVRDGEAIVRLQPHEVKVYATNRTFETQITTGRDYPGL